MGFVLSDEKPNTKGTEAPVIIVGKMKISSINILNSNDTREINVSPEARMIGVVSACLFISIPLFTNNF